MFGVSSSAFQTLSKHVWFVIRTGLASCLNAFGFSFERVWLFVRTHLACRSNTFGFSFERILYNDQTHPSCGANAFIHRANALGQKTRYTLCLTGNVYDVPASIELIISIFSSIVNTSFFRLSFSTILRISLKFYSFDKVTTVHAQSN